MKKIFKILIIVFIVIIIIGLILFSKRIYRISLIKNEKQALIEPNANDETTIIDVTNLSNDLKINHQHVLKTQYNNKEHWEECTVCNEKQNITKHSLIIQWARGYESCRADNSYTEICSCGYSHTDHKPCVWDGKSYMQYSNNYIHAKKCKNCLNNIHYKYYLGSELYEIFCEDEKYEYKKNTPFYQRCHLKDGTILDCKNKGVCSICGLNSIKNNHLIVLKNNKIFCQNCGEEYGEYSDEKVIRDSNDPGTYTVEFRVKLINGAKFNNTIGFYDIDWYDKNQQIVSEKNGDGTEFLLKTIVKFKSNYKVKQYPTLEFYITINGKLFMAQAGEYEFYPDITKPEISEITMNNGSETLTEWSRTKPITISGKENYCNNVKIKIVEEDNEENIIFEGGTTVENKNYSVSCIPEVKIETIGKKYKCIVTDECGNETEKNFEIAKIDSIAPIPTSEEIINSEWLKERDFTFTAVDTGIGDVEIAFNDEKYYKKAISNGTEFSKKYKFIGDVYQPKELSVLYKDGLGNTTMQKITIDKLDNTAPSITKAELHNNKLNITSHDEHETLGEGSGVTKYRYLLSTEKIENPELNSSNSIEINKEDEAKINEIYKIKYIYIQAEDLVGNLSEIYEFEVPQLVLTSKVNLNTENEKGEVILDWSTYNIQDKYFVIYRKQENEDNWETIVSLEEKFNGNNYIDISANDKILPNEPKINISEDVESNNITIVANSEDSGTKYVYYIEAYDSNNNLLNISN